MAKQSKNVINNLTDIIGKLPGIGPRSSRRLVMHLLKNRDSLMKSLYSALSDTLDNIAECELCYNIDMTSPCNICKDKSRNSKVICVVEEVVDLWAIERSKIMPCHYFVLGGALSALDGVGPDELKIPQLLDIIINKEIEEVILATNTTMEGQTTAYYINNILKKHKIKTSLLAQGIPIGGELDYLDEGTLTMALNSRKILTND
jgi:recombination protein RecR